MSAVSISVTPSSSAASMTARDCSRSQRAPKLLVPRPTTETSGPPSPSDRVRTARRYPLGSVRGGFGGRSLVVGARWSSRGKDAGSADSSAIGATEDAASRRPARPGDPCFTEFGASLKMFLFWAKELRQRRVAAYRGRSEEHTSELQSRPHLVCRLLLEKK